MVYSSLGKKTLSLLLAMSFIASGCLPGDVASTRSAFNSATPVGESVSGSGAGATTSGSTTGGSTITVNPTVEIRHLIEPNLSTDPNYSSGTGYAGGGSYVRKLTLPKNYAGKLYLAGINIASLANRHVTVRFNFGLGYEPVKIAGVVATAPGITPSTNIHVLVMDLRAEPFRNIRLSYDLFDYNDYAADGSPVQDNRDSGLYCRGLKVTDDSTFTGIGQCDGLQAGEECLYSYAKILDQGLVKEVLTTSPVTYVPTTPTLGQFRSVVGNNYYDDYMAQSLLKPLADNFMGPFKFSEASVPASPTFATNVSFLASSSPLTIDWTSKPIGSFNYYYRGPYRLVNKAEWEFKFPDLVGPKKLFRNSRAYTPGTGPTPEGGNIYFGSYLFPLATKLNLGANVPHMSSANWDDPRTMAINSTAQTSLWMDGSNARARSKNSDQEHIGSCNVSATIDILAKDDNGTEYIVANSNEVKLQLVRPTQYYTDTGTDVLYSNFKTCTSNATCGGSECCFNNRCWDQSLVSQCLDTSSSTGNRVIGDSCTTDLECSSLCCNRSSGLCAAHNTLSSPAVLCSKPIGDFCIAKEWCQKSPVIKTLIIKGPNNPNTGAVTCSQYSYTVQEYGDCKAGVCTAPFQATIPVFDPNAPGACDGAVPAPNF